jgi:hypothetical protein
MKKETEFLGNRKLIWHGRKRNVNRRAENRLEITPSKLQTEPEQLKEGSSGEMSQ